MELSEKEFEDKVREVAKGLIDDAIRGFPKYLDRSLIKTIYSVNKASGTKITEREALAFAIILVSRYFELLVGQSEKAIEDGGYSVERIEVNLNG